MTAADRPRVLHVYKDYYPPVMGGIETTINLMARGTLDDFEPSVLVCAGDGDPGVAFIDGVRVRRIKEWRRVSGAPLAPEFVTALREEAARADIIHLHHPNPTGDVALLLSGAKNPAVMTYHSDIVRQRFSRILFAPVQHWSMRRCAVIMPTSPQYLESSPWLRRYRKKCEVVPLGIDLRRFKKTPAIEEARNALRRANPGKLIVFVGRLRYYKGLEFLLKAMVGLPATLLIGGTGTDEERLQRISAGMNNVRFLGDLTEEQLVALLHAADIFCMPSHLRSEAFGLSMVEAMACAKPVVSARLDTGVCFVNRDGVSGVNVEPASPPALHEALGKLLQDDGLRARLAHGAVSRAQAWFSAEDMCGALKSVYRRVLEGA